MSLVARVVKMAAPEQKEGVLQDHSNRTGGKLKGSWQALCATTIGCPAGNRWLANGPPMDGLTTKSPMLNLSFLKKCRKPRITKAS
jgi:hypothetical protein